MSHTSTRRRGIVAGAAAFAAVMVTTAACGTQSGSDISDHGSTLSVPRHESAQRHATKDDATSATNAEHRLQEKAQEKFTPPPAEIGVPR